MTVSTRLLQQFESYGDRLRRSVESLDESNVGQVFAVRNTYYKMLEAYYANEQYLRADADNAAIRNWAGLPRTIRPISMIPRAAVEWWRTMVYYGTWTPDGLPDKTGEPNRLPYDEDTRTPLRLVGQQAFTWGGGPKLLGREVLTGAKLGECLAEVEVSFSDEEGGSKVYPHLVHPRHVVSLDLSERGDVRAYRLAIPRRDEKGEWYLWGKEVTRTGVTTYRNDQEQGFDGAPASFAHPYGFCPAVWFTHNTTSGFHGAPVIDGAIPTIDEYQGVLASIDDYLHKFVNQLIAVETNNPRGLRDSILGRDQLAPRRPGLPTESYEAKVNAMESIGVLPIPAGSRIHPTIANLGLGDAESHIKRLQEELLNAFPELQLYEKLLEMDQVTRPGAVPLVRMVQGKYNDVCSNYDQQNVKLVQMCAAIGGYHISEGDWGLGSTLTKAQKKFEGFGLEDYDRGALDFSLSPRQLIPPTLKEKLEEAALIEGLTTATGLRHIGRTDVEIYGQKEGAIPKPPYGILEEKQVNAGTTDRLNAALEEAFLRGETGEPGQVPAPGESGAPAPVGAAA